MLTEQRKRHLIDLLARTGRIVARQVAVELAISEDTIRRDLRELASEGRLQRVHGGALPVSPALGGLRARAAIAPAEKVAIGRCAAAMIRPSQVVFIDGGTTALELARHIDPDLEATVVTHSPIVASALAGHAVDVIAIGGRLFKHSMVSVGVAALNQCATIRPDIFFMGVTGVHPEAGLTTGDAEEAEMKRAIAGSAAELVVLASSEKIGAASSFLIAPAARADRLVVPRTTPRQIVAAFRRLGVEVTPAAA